MRGEHAVAGVRRVLQQFQDGYAARDLSRLDEFMDLFAQGPDTELIGIGATRRGRPEWFEGPEQIREIIESDWTTWGDVRLDVQDARITTRGGVSWPTTTGQLVQTAASDQALSFYLQRMADVLADETTDGDDRLWRPPTSA